jgi:hypothetical protein
MCFSLQCCSLNCIEVQHKKEKKQHFHFKNFKKKQLNCSVYIRTKLNLLKHADYWKK